jgi:hypothetical protein
MNHRRREFVSRPPTVVKISRPSRRSRSNVLLRRGDRGERGAARRRSHGRKALVPS